MVASLGEVPREDSDPHTWTDQQVCAYLKSVNLADKYLEIFLENEINGMVLMNLTKEKLKAEPFCIKAYAPLETIMGAIDLLKSRKSKEGAAQPTSSAPAAQAAARQSPDRSSTQAQGRQQQPQQQQQQQQESQELQHHQSPPTLPKASFESSDMWGGWGGMQQQLPQVPIGMVFPYMPPPPLFPNGFPMPEVAHRRGAHEPHQAQPHQTPPHHDLDYTHGMPPLQGEMWSMHDFAPTDKDLGSKWFPQQPNDSEPQPYNPAFGQMLLPEALPQQQHPARGQIESTSLPRLESPGSSPSPPPRDELDKELHQNILRNLNLVDQPREVPGEEIGSEECSSAVVPFFPARAPSMEKKNSKLRLISEFQIAENTPSTAGKRYPQPRIETVCETTDEIPKFIPVEVDLTTPPSNWLDSDKRVAPHFNPGLVDIPSQEFPSAALIDTSFHAPDQSPGDLLPSPTIGSNLTSDVDIIAPAENLRTLFTAPYTSGNLALSIHRVGGSLVLEGGIPGGPQRKTQDDMMMSKLLYYSILAEDRELEKELKETMSERSHNSSSTPSDELPSPPLECAGEGQATSPIPPGEKSSPIEETPEGSTPSASEPHADEQQPPVAKNANGQVLTRKDTFYRNLRWHFQDLNILLGSNQLIMRHDNGQEVLLRLREAGQPLTAPDALEYWIDNVMNNVPQVAICYHKEGITQGYQLISTADLPTIATDASFEPQVVQEYAGNVLHWLKENCSREAGSYILVRDAGTSSLKLYDLSGMYDEEVEPTNAKKLLMMSGDEDLVTLKDATTDTKVNKASRSSSRYQPFAYPVAMLCFRMGSRLVENINSTSPEQAQKAVTLLTKASDLLPDSAEPLAVAQSHIHLATAHVLASRQSPSPVPEQSDVGNGKKKKGAAADRLPAVMLGEDRSNFSLREAGLKASSKELTTALQILQDEHHYDTVQNCRERLIHCYLGLAVIAADEGHIGDALEWVSLAEEMITVARRAVHQGGRAITAPPSTETLSGETVEKDQQKVEEIATLMGDPPFLVLCVVRLLETLGDIHQSIINRLLTLPPDAPPEEATEVLSPHQASLSKVLEGREGESFMKECSPLTTDVDINVQRGLRYFVTGITMISKLKLSIPRAGVEVLHSTQSDLKMKLGGMNNLAATYLMRSSRLNKAYEYFNQALQYFTSTKDKSARLNHALICMNLGKLMQKWAQTERSKSGKESLSSQEEVYYNRGISYYQEALNILSESKVTQSKLYSEALRLSAWAEFNLAIRYKQNIVDLMAEQPDVDFEKRIVDLLLSAQKGFEVAGSTALEGECCAHLGQLYSIALRLNQEKNPNQQRQERRFKLAELYFKKAEEAAGSNTVMFLRVRREMARLHFYQLQYVTTHTRKDQHLRTIIRLLTKLLPCLTNSQGDTASEAPAAVHGEEIVVPESTANKEAEMKAEIELIHTLLRDVLKEATKLYQASSESSQPKRNLTGKTANRAQPLDTIKALYKQSLTDEASTEAVIKLIEESSKLLLPHGS